jgi:hypothetical protein
MIRIRIERKCWIRIRIRIESIRIHNPGKNTSVSANKKYTFYNTEMGLHEQSILYRFSREEG